MHVPAAKFQKGNRGGTGGESRAVAVAGFCIDKTEVTVKAYAACVAAKGCAAGPRMVTNSRLEEQERESWFCNQDDRPDHPINCVHWDEAVAYCDRAGKRLPTAEEWEYAAQGQDGRPYPWGDDPPSERRLNACGTECTAVAKRVLKRDYPALYKASDGWEATAPVGSFPGGASPFGVLDMAGNVSEWIDLRTTGSARLCGGSWLSDTEGDVQVERYHSMPVRYRLNFIGFRCARDQ